jgi:Protein of unknown function (DUF4232)
MDSQRPDRILEEWSAVADGARRPSTPPRRVAVRAGSAGLSLAGASLVAVVLLAAAVWLGRPGSTGPGAVVDTGSPSATILETPVPSNSPAPTATPTPPTTPAPTPTAAPTPAATPMIRACAPAALAAKITLWEGAAGSRIADVEVTNSGDAACTLEKVERPQLIDGAGRVLIDGTAPSSREVIDLSPGGRVKTLVDVSNYCGAAPVPPVRVAFVLRDGQRFIAAPPTPTEATVPPCNGPGQPAVIGMQPWAR